MGFMMRRSPAAAPSVTIDLGDDDDDLEPRDSADAVPRATTKRHA
jgi:hypothetical protein